MAPKTWSSHDPGPAGVALPLTRTIVRIDCIGGPVKTPWEKKAVYVEWDLTGDADSGFGAVIYPSTAPMVVVMEIDARYRTYEQVAAAVTTWISSVADRYRLNEEFERFKILAHEMDGEAPPMDGLGYVRRPPG